MLVLLFSLLLVLFFLKYGTQNDKPIYGKRHPPTLVKTDTSSCYMNAPKPPWVKKEIVKLKALMPDSGCRKIAATFNRQHASHGMTVSKSHVANLIRDHQYEIQVLKRKIKHQRPKPVPKNLIWGMDLTGKCDIQHRQHHILGIVDHASRGLLYLDRLSDKASITLLRCILDCIEVYGHPTFIRTDNEAIFTSKLFRLGLWCLRIKHQTTDLHSPWQNGRIERLFGTLKERLNQWDVSSVEQLSNSLQQFRFWYNHVRPHQYLNDRTPAEVWNGRDIFKCKSKKVYWFEAWEGLLGGYYFPP